jgi:hypothetical protein
LASAQAAINSYLAFTQTLADPTIPSMIAKSIMAATVLASGLAQQIKIIKTPIPSAETGGRFIVPDTFTRTDSAVMKVGPGEQVDITPKGMVGGSGAQFNFNFVMDGQVFARVINRQARAGELYTLQLADNL